MKIRDSLLISAIAVSALLSVSSVASAAAINPSVQSVSLPGSPFAETSTPNGQYAFASLSTEVSGSGATNGIAIIKQGPSSASLVRILPTGGETFGLAITADGRYLLDDVLPSQGATSPQGVQIIDVQKAIAGQPGAILATVPTTGPASGPGLVALSNDDRFVFVGNEDTGNVSVINLAKALETGGAASSLVGNIPVDRAPAGLAVSPDGRYLYVTSEEANPTDPGYNPTACNIPTGIGTPTPTQPGPEGTLAVVSVAKAETNPASSVLADDYAGCSPVRVALSDHGQVAWVTARAQNDVLAFDTQRLLSDPAKDLISSTPVGGAPVGLQLFDDERLIAVANSNRFTTGQAGTASILDSRRALDGAGSSATVGTFPAGDFPREWGVSNDDRFLYLTEYSSNALAVLSVQNLVGELQASDPSLGPWFPSPFGPFVPQGPGPFTPQGPGPFTPQGPGPFVPQGPGPSAPKGPGF